MPNKPARRNVTYHAPVGSIDLAAFDEDGNSCEIRPCPECLPWHAEVINDPETHGVLVREWHAIECPHFEYLLNEDAGGQPGPQLERP
ncbi:Uncharacterised protein [Mycobacteroides abscessus subsp. abscessus]|uniref:hypothetical protein n=1 Tax=Mycobacteroides abscessus TaxID=36809 RepID=UPI00092A0DB0|nr:hypothetical protein [Mycobacteroides abscessus]SIH56851.1 Uncharacterised protein [Mycobacteroides abscessus subsp. abscessus]